MPWDLGRQPVIAKEMVSRGVNICAQKLHETGCGLYLGRLHVVLELLHEGVGHGHVLEHALQLGRELTAALRL